MKASDWYLGIVLILSGALGIILGLMQVADAIRDLKPTITLHEHPTKIVQLPAPRPSGLLPEAR